MRTFRFRGIDQRGRTQAGELGAADEVELEDLLRGRGVWLLEARPGPVRRRAVARHYRTSRRDLIQFCTLLAFQTRVGVPLVQALEAAAQDDESRGLRELVTALARRVESGATLTEALEEFPRSFSREFSQLIRSGEQGGSLPEAFLQLKSHLEWQERVAAEVKQATLYPIVILLATIAFVLVLFTFVVPKFSMLLTAAKVPLPGPTQFIFALSSLLKESGAWLLGGAAVAAGLLAGIRRRSPRAARGLDRVRLHLPVIGPLARLLILTRFAHNLAILYRSGVSLPNALELVGGVLGSAVASETVGRIRLRVLEGTTLSDALRRHPVFPALLIRLVAVGERTGQLDQTLAQVASHYHELLPRRLKRLLTLLEPALILALVGVVGFVALAVVLPVLSLMQSLR